MITYFERALSEVLSFSFSIPEGKFWYSRGCRERRPAFPKLRTMTPDSGIKIPGRLPLLLTHEGVLLPGSTTRFSVDSARNMNLVRQRLLRGTSLKSTIIGVIPNSRDPEQNTDELPALHK